MIDVIYVENAVREHPRTLKILQRFSKAAQVPIERYGEVFNVRVQNFRLQKHKPALILAEKHAGHVLPAPAGYGIGGVHNYYFSHMLNCLYDCRYCFLQGMYASANYVLFVNYEDYFDGLEKALAEHPGETAYFFSGYDCDSLALESVTGFVETTLPWFRDHPQAVLELRTKSIQTRPLMDVEPMDNCVVAYSLTPDAVARTVEHGAPSVDRRIEAMAKLAKHGWPIGLRFDPLIWGQDWAEHYTSLFEAVFRAVPPESIHSVSYGPMRFPKAMYKDIVALYPHEPLFAGPMSTESGMMAYAPEIEAEMGAFCRKSLANWVKDTVFFQCTVES